MNQTQIQQQISEHQQTTTGYPPRYRIFEEEMGFCVEGRDRRPVFVRLSPDRTHMLVASNVEGCNSPDGNALKCSLYGYYRLLDSIASIAMQEWERPSNPPSMWGGVREWAIGRTKRALHFRGVYQQWQRLLTLVPEPQRAVAKAVFVATFDSSQLGCETWPEVYHSPYLVEDILRYRAAACAIHYAQDLALRVSSVVEQRCTVAPTTYRPGPLTERFKAIAQRRSSNGLVHFDDFKDWEQVELLQKQADALDRRDILAILVKDWKTLYSGSGAAGKSLRKVLMDLPGGISGKLLGELPKLDLFLSRPITDRVELLILLLWSSHVTPFSHTLISPEA